MYWNIFYYAFCTWVALAYLALALFTLHIARPWWLIHACERSPGALVILAVVLMVLSDDTNPRG